MKKLARTDHWLARPTTIKLSWRLFVVLLALTLVGQFAVSIKGYFVLDGWFGFGAVFGFLSCLLMVLVAKCLGYLLKRREHYYGEQEPDQ